LQRELLEDAVYSYEDRMWSLYSNCLEGELSDDDSDKVYDAIEAMNDPQTAFYSILSSLFQSEGHGGAAKSTAFGGKVLIAGSREVIHINHDLLFGLIFVLLLIVAPEDERPKIPDLEKLYLQLLNYMREYEVLNWMARTPLSVPDFRLSVDEELTMGLASLKVTTSDPTSVPKKKKGSALQLMLPENSAPPSHRRGMGGTLALSLCITQYLASLELANHGNGFADVASALLNNNATGVAMQFQKYIPTTSWGFYVKGRIQLKDRNQDAASMTFRKAAYGLCMFLQ
jgi:nuclear pore complex protein Nup160